MNICSAQTQNSATDLESNFFSPPNSSKPRTWMHAMSGNMSKEGMTKDLEALAAAGQGGILLFNIANGIPYGNVPYNSDEHHKILTHTAKECERLNLSFGVHNCDGWTSSGGPWISPEDSMKMVVWSETIADGGGTVSIDLPQPTTHEDFYKDIAVLAYPALESEIIDAEAEPIITASDSAFDVSIVSDDLNTDAAHLNKPEDENSWLLLDFKKIHEVSSVYLSYFGNNKTADLEISNDGINFTSVKNFGSSRRIGKKKRIISEQFKPIKAQYFRFTFSEEMDIREVKLTASKPFNNYLGYSGLSSPGDYMDIDLNPDAGIILKKSSILNLSAELSPEGNLVTKLPKGKWTIMRFGYTSTGTTNWPASKWGRGLECDKFSRPALKKHFDAFAQKVINNSKGVAPNALQYIEIDSYEMGGQNWTENFDLMFKEEKGYDIIPYLPIFAGRYVESAEAVAGIAYDLNNMYTGLMTNNYFKYFTELCNENGLKSYIEPYGSGPVSTLDISEHIDLPMTEFWMNRENQRRLTGTIDGAHIYGKKIISAEAFTSKPDLNWKNHPALAKTWGDMAWISGVNEFMFHRFVHQANTHVKPGLTMGYWGSHFDRTQTWWMNAGVAWFDYIARGSYLLRQGYPVADVLVFAGDLPHKDGIRRDNLKYELPLGLNFDCTNAHALINRMSIKDKTLLLPEGNAYSYLVLQDFDVVTLPTLRRIKEIADAGIQIIGEKPLQLAGYKVTAEQAAEFKELSNSIWSKPNCQTQFDFNKLQPDFTVADKEVPFVHRKTDNEDIYFFYNEKEDATNFECNFKVANKIPELWNPNTGETRKLANFKTDANSTKLWLKLEGLESAFVVFREPSKNVRSIVGAHDDRQLYLNEDNTVEVEVSSDSISEITWSDGKISKISEITLPEPVNLNTDWNVDFLAEHDFKATRKFSELSDWKDSDEDAIKYYSGTAIYKKNFSIAIAKKDKLRYILDLGEVDIVAEVLVNGQNAGVLWLAPFEVDITDYLKKGKNELEIRITNQWSNRLIGDENYPPQDGGYQKSGYIPSSSSQMPQWYTANEPMPEGPRTTFTSWDFYKKGDELMPSGLKGPVQIKHNKIITLSADHN
ncbi:MAG: glycosyl hydrolase [Leeuwenhoekiella sp.]